jgi:hypothetical protein
MGRLWICLPLCLLLQDQNPQPSNFSGTADLGRPPPDRALKRRLEIGRGVTSLAAASPLGFPAALPWTGLPLMAEHLVPPHLGISADIVAGLAGAASPGHSWGPLQHALVTHGPRLIEDVCYADAPRFLEMIIAHYEREVTGYSCTLFRRERINGKLHDLEVTEVRFREKPFGVFMNWKEGTRFLGPQAVLYVENENEGKVLARPAGRLAQFAAGIVSKDVEGSDAKNSGRYTLNHFGLHLGTKRTLATMRKAQERGTLHVQYYGIERVPQLDHRPCYKFVRTPYDPVEEEGVNELTLFIDVETWLQTGSVLRDRERRLIAEYFFRDVRLNPTFAPKDFQRGAL